MSGRIAVSNRKLGPGYIYTYICTANAPENVKKNGGQGGFSKSEPKKMKKIKQVCS